MPLGNLMEKKVSIVIPTKNGGLLFQKVLLGIKEQKFSGSIEVVVIDSGSDDGTFNFAKNHGATVVSVPPDTFNHGKTRNRGIEISSGDIVVLMTQDAVPANEYLIHNLVSAFEDHDVAGSYARQLPRKDADIFTKRTLNNWLTGREESEVRQIVNFAEYRSMKPIDQYLFCNFDNVCSAIRRSVWEQIPLFANDFGEDIDWSKRALEAGWKIAYQSKASVIHSHDRSILYEYKRTYMCHRKLYELFKIQTIPSKKYVFLSILNSIKKDWLFAIRCNETLLKKFFLLGKCVPLCVASSLGQYCGAKDEKSSFYKKYSGV